MIECLQCITGRSPAQKAGARPPGDPCESTGRPFAAIPDQNLLLRGLYERKRPFVLGIIDGHTPIAGRNLPGKGHHPKLEVRLGMIGRRAVRRVGPFGTAVLGSAQLPPQPRSLCPVVQPEPSTKLFVADQPFTLLCPDRLRPTQSVLTREPTARPWRRRPRASGVMCFPTRLVEPVR